MSFFVCIFPPSTHRRAFPSNCKWVKKSQRELCTYARVTSWPLCLLKNGRKHRHSAVFHYLRVWVSWQVLLIHYYTYTHTHIHTQLHMHTHTCTHGPKLIAVTLSQFPLLFTREISNTTQRQTTKPLWCLQSVVFHFKLCTHTLIQTQWYSWWLSNHPLN